MSDLPDDDASIRISRRHHELLKAEAERQQRSIKTVISNILDDALRTEGDCKSVTAGSEAGES